MSAFWTSELPKLPPGPPEGWPLGKPDGGDPVGCPDGNPEGRLVGKLDERPAALRHFWIFFCRAGSWENPPPGPPVGNPEGVPDPAVEEDEEPHPLSAVAPSRPTSNKAATRWMRGDDIRVPLGCGFSGW